MSDGCGRPPLIYRRLGPPPTGKSRRTPQLFTWAMGIATAIAIGADDDVATLRGRLGAYRGHHVVNGRYAMAYGGPVELWLGMAAAHLGLVDEAIADLEHAVKSCAVNGADGCRAETEYELASALVRRSAPGDLIRARAAAARGERPDGEARDAADRAKAAALLDRHRRRRSSAH